MSASAPNYLNTTLYVGDLHHAVTEAMLFDKFSRVAPVVSIRVCRHVITRRSLGYAYVNFRDPAGAEHALKTMNFELIMGRPIRIMWSQRDPSLRKSGIGNIFVKNLEKSIDSLALKNMFSRFGNILSCKVACNGRGSKGHGFVHFETMEAAENAIIEMNGTLFNDRKVFVGHFRSRQERETETGDKEKDFTNIYIKNFGKDMNDKRLKETFGKYGPTVSVRVMTDNWGKSKGFGFVSYQRHEDAERAVDSMNGTEINGRRIYVARAQKWAERQAAQICQLEQKKQETMTTHYQVMTEGGFSKASEALHEEDCLAQQENMCIQMMANNQALSNPVVNLHHQLEPSLAINYHPALHSVINPNQPEPNCMAHNYLCVPCSGIHCQPMLPPAIDPCQPVPIPAITNVQPLPNLTINDQPEPKKTVTIDQPMLSSAITTDQPVPNSAATNDQPVLNPAIGYQPVQHTTFDVYPPVPSMAFSSYQHVPSSAFGFDHPVLCPRFNPYQTALPVEDFMATFPQAQNVNAYNPINQMAQLIPGRCWAPESMWSQDLQIFPGHPRLSVPYFGNVMPALTQVPDEMTYLKFDTRNPMRFPIGLPVDATPISGVTQFGCTAGVDDSLEQLSTQPQCTLMQPTIPEPLTISFLASLSNDDREQTLGHRLYPLIQDQKPDLAPKITGMLLELENSEILQLLESSESLHSKVDEAVAVLQAFWASEATAAGLASRALQDNRTAGEHNPEQQKINPPPQGTKQQPAVPVQKQDPLTLSYLDGLSYNDRDQILGKHLHSLILGQQPDLAPKITGMLLELENNKILKFLETPESLHAKVSEAVSVLQDFWAKEAETKANAEETVTTKVNAEETVTTKVNAEEAVTTEVNAEEAVTTKGNAEETMTTEGNAEETMTTEVNAEEAVTTEVNAEEAVTTEVNAEETMTTEVNAEH